MKKLFFCATILACIAGCAGTNIQQSSENDLGENSKIILADRTGDVDGHKTPFAKEYIVTAGNHIVGICNGGALCEKYYYIEFDAKPGFTYTVYNQARSISASNRAGHLVDTRGFENQLRDGVPTVISFNDEAARPSAPQENNAATSNNTLRKVDSSAGLAQNPMTASNQRVMQALRSGDSSGVEAAIKAGGDPSVIRLRDVFKLPYGAQPAIISIMHRHGVDWGMSSDDVLIDLTDHTVFWNGLTEEQSVQAKLAVVDALIAAGFHFTPNDIRNATRQYLELQQRNALTLLHKIAEHSGNEKAYTTAVDQFDAQKLATEKAQYETQQNAAAQARIVGTKICKSAPGIWRQALGTALGQTVYGNEQRITYFVTGFTEGVSGTRIQIRIAGIQVPSTSAEFQNVDRIDGDTVLAVNNVIWDDSINWKPCD